MSEELKITIKNEGATEGPGIFGEGAAAPPSPPPPPDEVIQEGISAQAESIAAKRLRQKELSRQVEEAMRAQDEEYDDDARKRRRREALREQSLKQLDDRREKQQDPREQERLATEKARSQQDKDEDYVARQERRDAARARRLAEQAQTQQQRDEDYAARQARRDAAAAAKKASLIQTQQDRDEDYAAKQERRDAAAAARKAQQAQSQQERDEDYAARQTRRDEQAAARKAAQAQTQQQRDEDWLARRDAADVKAAEREAERLGKQFVAENPGVKAVVDAEAAKKKKAFNEQYDEERRKADPDYDHAKDMDEKQKQMGSVNRIAAAVSGGQGGPAAIMQGAGELMGGAGGAALLEAVPLAGAIYAGAKMVEAKLKEFGEQLGQTTGKLMEQSNTIMAGSAGFDNGKGLVKAVGDAMIEAAGTTKAAGLPGMIFGPSFEAAVKGNVDRFTMLNEVVEQTATRFSTLHSGLAQQAADQDYQRYQLYQARANRFGSQIQGANDARFGLEMRLAQLTDRFAPFVYAFAEKLFRLVETGVGIADEGFKAMLKQFDFFLEHITMFSPAMAMAANQIAELRRLIAIALEDNTVGEGIDLVMFRQSMTQLTATFNQQPNPGAGSTAPGPGFGGV